jgi:hypothetical protein
MPEEKLRMSTQFQPEGLKHRDHLGDLRADGKIILEPERNNM